MGLSLVNTRDDEGFGLGMEGKDASVLEATGHSDG